ncbi:Gp37 family protein [Paraburkholderia fungorum]|uniref:Gp37 family protein n=1 Tax=Paraburkholderia fungorum TaxID=134537 RepID=UPI00402BEF18
MSVIASIEALVVARLTAALTITGQAHPCVDVEPWPDDPVAYKMIHPLGAVLVMYHGAKFDETATARQLIGFDARFEIGLLSKTLRAPVVGVDASEPDTGVYTLLDACRAAFVGWQPDGAANTARLVAEFSEGYREGCGPTACRLPFRCSRWLIASRRRDCTTYRTSRPCKA